MDFNSSGDYFTYKRKKIEKNSPTRQKKYISKVNFLLQLSIVTFLIVVVLILVGITKFSSKMDIECSRSDLSEFDPASSHITANVDDTPQGKIDKRLILIQQEENAPNEAKKIITDNKQNSLVIDPKLVEANKEIENRQYKEFKEKQLKKQQQKQLEAQNKDLQAPKPGTKLTFKPPTAKQNEEIKTNAQDKTTQANQTLSTEQKQEIKPSTKTASDNLIIMSKVFIGRYANLDEAQAMQNTIKNSNPHLTPYVKKVGNVFTIQMGSYQDFNVARKFAQRLQAKGFEVWIYQQ